MYEELHTTTDTLKEKYIYGCELSKYGYPILDRAVGYPEECRPVPFNLISKEKYPRECIAHFYINDESFERIWSNADRYIDCLRNFKYVISPDFTCFSDLPMPLRQFQTYKNHAIGYYMSLRGINVIPNVGWNAPDSYDWCFDGLPERSILAVSTNGCNWNEETREHYRHGFHAMCERLKPLKVIVVGSKIEVDDDIEIHYLDSFSQQMKKRIEHGK